MKKIVIAAALGECVHVAGISRFLQLAEQAGWKTIFLGPATPIDHVLKTIQETGAGMVGVSYRLTPETGERLLGDFAEAADDFRRQGVRFLFAGTPPLAEKARALNFFEKVFEGGEPADETLAFLKGGITAPGSMIARPPQTLVERIAWKSPYPLLRHHFGLPAMSDTISGIEQIADAGVMDVISLGIDQDAQENFYHPERQDPRRKGAGGVPVRSDADYEELYNASRRGNYPLMRTYSGTDDFIRLAEMYSRTIHNAWCAIPLFWFNRMDGRGPWDLEGSIVQHQQVMAWHGSRGIPVELNEPHHWGMRDASDVTCVVSAYLSAYNAKYFGVKDFIAQFMFNSPPGLSDAMDLAKMLAILNMIQPLATSQFKVWTQTRTGLLSYPVNPIEAKAHLVASIYLQMALKPQIVHVVSYSEAHHAAIASDVIESCRLARRAIENASGAPDMRADPAVRSRSEYLVHEANILLEAIRELAGNISGDPFVDPKVLCRAVTTGILDAPQLKNNPYGRGETITRILQGSCVTVDAAGNPVSEQKRLQALQQRREK